MSPAVALRFSSGPRDVYLGESFVDGRSATSAQIQLTSLQPATVDNCETQLRVRRKSA